MASERERDLSIVGDLLEYARVKRTAAGFAKGEQDIVNQKRLLKEAAVMEAAANRLDSAHEHQGWKASVE